jgi:hypothetical protein
MLPLFLKCRIPLGGLSTAAISYMNADTTCKVDRASMTIVSGMYGAWIPYIFHANPGSALLLPVMLSSYGVMKQISKNT